LPVGFPRVKPKKAFFCKRSKELDHEVGIACALLIDKAREEWLSACTPLMEDIGDELVHVAVGKRAKHDVLHQQIAFADRAQRKHERMGRADLIVPVCADK